MSLFPGKFPEKLFLSTPLGCCWAHKTLSSVDTFDQGMTDVGGSTGEAVAARERGIGAARRACTAHAGRPRAAPAKMDTKRSPPQRYKLTCAATLISL